MHLSVKNLLLIKENIKALYDHYFLPPKNIHIIAVSKNQPAEKIIPLLEYGHRIFGENRVQEAIEKWTPLKEIYPDIELHLIGNLQTNKVKKALTIFDAIQTIDSTELIDEIIKVSGKTDGLKHPKYFIQVNTGLEPQKSGISFDQLDQLSQYLCDFQLKLSGLMCIPPINEDSIYHFSLLQSLIRQHNHTFNHCLLMSAGMSGDYPKALLCQTDYIRIGTAIFGDR